MKLFLVLFFFVGIALGQPSIVFPVENAYYPGNSNTKFAAYYGIPLGTVIDNCPPTVITSISYRPTFSAGYAHTIYGAQSVTIVLKMSSGYMNTWNMTSPDCVDKANTYMPLGQAGTSIYFPSTKTVYPMVGLQAILAEPFSIKIPFTVPYIHSGGSLQMFMGWPAKNDNQEVATIDTDVVGDPYGSASGYTHMGNYSSLPYSSPAYYLCLLAAPPKTFTRGVGNIPTNTYIEASARIYGEPAVLFLTNNLLGQTYNWTGVSNAACSIQYDLINAIGIPFVGNLSLPIGFNPWLEKAYVSSLVIGAFIGYPYTSLPTVITVPTTYPLRAVGSQSKHVPAARSMLPTTDPADWMVVVTGIN